MNKPVRVWLLATPFVGFIVSIYSWKVNEWMDVRMERDKQKEYLDPPFVLRSMALPEIERVR